MAKKSEKYGVNTPFNGRIYIYTDGHTVTDEDGQEAWRFTPVARVEYSDFNNDPVAAWNMANKICDALNAAEKK